MTKVLAPSFKVPRRTATLIPKADEEIPQAVGVEIGQVDGLEGSLEDPSDWVGVPPVLQL